MNDDWSLGNRIYCKMPERDCLRSRKYHWTGNKRFNSIQWVVFYSRVSCASMTSARPRKVHFCSFPAWIDGLHPMGRWKKNWIEKGRREQKNVCESQKMFRLWVWDAHNSRYAISLISSRDARWEIKKRLEAAANRFHSEIQVPDRCDPDEVTKFRHPVGRWEFPSARVFVFFRNIRRASLWIVSSFALEKN